MRKMKVIEKDFDTKYLGGGITFHPSKIAFGISLKYWKCLYAPVIEIHLFCFKVWIYLTLKPKKNK